LPPKPSGIMSSSSFALLLLASSLLL